MIEDLVGCQVVINNNGALYSASPNIKFPSQPNAKIKAIYQQFDEWDKTFATAFSFEKIIEKTMIRRISEKHLPLVQKQIENVFDVIRNSEMSLISRDQEPIVFLQLNLSKGK